MPSYVKIWQLILKVKGTMVLDTWATVGTGVHNLEKTTFLSGGLVNSRSGVGLEALVALAKQRTINLEERIGLYRCYTSEYI